MKDRLRKRRYNPKAKKPINLFGKRLMKSLRKYYKSMTNNKNMLLLGEELFKDIF